MQSSTTTEEVHDRIEEIATKGYTCGERTMDRRPEELAAKGDADNPDKWVAEQNRTAQRKCNKNLSGVD